MTLTDKTPVGNHVHYAEVNTEILPPVCITLHYIYQCDSRFLSQKHVSSLNRVIKITVFSFKPTTIKSSGQTINTLCFNNIPVPCCVQVQYKNAVIGNRRIWPIVQFRRTALTVHC